MPASQFITSDEPNENNIVTLLDDVYTRYQSIEQARWDQSNIDLKFWAGDQDYVTSTFSFTPRTTWDKFYFNIIQQPCNMVSGYQRQHRKSMTAVPVEGSDDKTATQFTKLLVYANNKNHLNEKFSQACEQSMTSGMVLMQPFLNYSKDPINGDLDLKIWEYNSFLMDPYWRDSSMSDCNFVWCQKYISKQEAIADFPDHADIIRTMSGYNQSYARFYFLPENYNIARDNLLVLSYYWYRKIKKKKKIFNHDTGEMTEYHDTEEMKEDFLANNPSLEEVEIEVAVWENAVLLNKTLLHIGGSPLGDSEISPFVPVFWNYDPYIPNYTLRCRSLVRTLRDAQFLFNRRVIINHDISETSINSGFMYFEDSIGNEDVLTYAGQGKNIQVKNDPRFATPGQAIEKIIPQSVPSSDMQLADQLMNLTGPLSGVSEVLTGMADDRDAGITTMLRQGAGLVTLQKYFDQWDMAFKLWGKIEVLLLQKWRPFKIFRILKEEPTDQFYDKNFGSYDILVEEGLNTIVQRQQNFVQAINFQQLTETKLPLEYLIDISMLQDKEKLTKMMVAQQQAQQAIQQQQMQLEMAKLEGDLENTRADTAEKLAMARERMGRTHSNIGLEDEREAEVTQNRAAALKEKVSALKELLDMIETYGESEVIRVSQALEEVNINQKVDEEISKSQGDRDIQINLEDLLT